MIEMFEVKRRLGVLAVVAWVAVAGAQQEWTGPESRPHFEGVAFGVLSGVFEETPSSDGWRSEFMVAFAGAVAAQSGQDATPRYPDDFEVCAYLTGAGGNPRLDGGGSLLALAPDFITAPNSQSAGRGDYRLTLEAVQVPTITILDEFEIGSLFDSLDGRLNGGAISVDEVEGARDLWRTFVRYLYEPEDDFDEDVTVRHGHVVAFHALARLPEGALVTAVESRPAIDPDRLVLDVQVGGTEFEVHLVHVDFERLPSIGDALRSIDRDTFQVVIMSWGLVDCALERAYEAGIAESTVDPAHLSSLAAYLHATLAESESFRMAAEELCDEVQAQLEVPLGLAPGTLDCSDRSVLASLSTAAVVADVSSRSRGAIDYEAVEGTMYFVASGNQGLGFPMPPAGWPGFLGVEACTLGRPDRSRFSNEGTVLGSAVGTIRALGAWFETDLLAIHEASQVAIGPVGYWGTSFAAPTVAMAYALTQDDPTNGMVLAPCD